MTNNLCNLLINVIGGGKSSCFAQLLLLTILIFAACTDDSPVSPEPENLIETRSAADSTAVGDSATTSVTAEVDTTWAATYTYDYDGNLILDSDEPQDGDVDEAL